MWYFTVSGCPVRSLLNWSSFFSLRNSSNSKLNIQQWIPCNWEKEVRDKKRMLDLWQWDQNFKPLLCLRGWERTHFIFKKEKYVRKLILDFSYTNTIKYMRSYYLICTLIYLLFFEMENNFHTRMEFTRWHIKHQNRWTPPHVTSIKVVCESSLFWMLGMSISKTHRWVWRVLLFWNMHSDFPDELPYGIQMLLCIF